MPFFLMIFRFLCAICFAYCPIASRSHHYNVVSFASEIDDNLCLSATTALLSGWNYNLLLATPSKNENAKNMKVEFYKNYVNNASLAENDILVLADAYDVVFQRDVHHFMHKLRTLLATELETTKRDVVYFMAEKNCWPALNPKRKEYYCPMAQGHAFYQNKPNHTAINCRKQVDLAPSHHSHTDIGKFLNSGLCVGSVRALRRLFSDYENLRDSLVPKCHDDQGIFSTLYVLGDSGISLDYHAAMMESAHMQNHSLYVFDAAMGAWGRKGNVSQAPSLLHFNGDKRPFQPFAKQLISWHNTHHPPDRNNRQAKNHTAGSSVAVGSLAINSRTVDLNDVCGVNSKYLKKQSTGLFSSFWNALFS